MKKVVLITGGSKGIGFACVNEFLKHGWEIITTSRNPPPIKDSRVHFYKANFYKNNEVIEMAKNVKHDFDEIHAIIHCVGDIIEDNQIKEIDINILNKTFQINFFSAVLIAKEFFDYITKTRGVFIYITSIAKDKIYPNIPAYCAAKAALSNFVKSLAYELSSYRARAVAISPAVVDTDLFRKSKYTAEEAAKWHKLGRIGKPEEIAFLIYFLASERATWITGVDYIIDGGMLL